MSTKVMTNSKTYDIINSVNKMIDSYTLKVIAHIHSDFKTKFGIPRQSGIVDELQSTVVFEPEYSNKDAFRDIEQFSHLWLIWQFSEAVRDDWSPTVRPPRLGGNKRVGVFATRSPFRPNSLGLSCVKLIDVYEDEQSRVCLNVSGADLMDGTPIFDVKPYLAFADSIPDSIGGFADERYSYSLKVNFDDSLISILPESKRNSAIKVLEHDPRPSYQKDPERIYGMEFAGFEIKFKVNMDELTVISVKNNSADN